MISLLRSLPQGMFWYPLLLFLTFSLGRVVWSVSRQLSSGKSKTRPESGHLASLVSLVQRAQTDQFAHQELERRCVGILLQASGYTGYSVENCRSFLRATPTSPATAAVEGHLAEVRIGRRVSGLVSSGPTDRINHILEAVERITEAPRG